MQQLNFVKVRRDASIAVIEGRARPARMQRHAAVLVRPRRPLEKRVELRKILIDGGPYRQFRIC